MLRMLTASDEPPIHELQHLHWNCFLVKTRAFESTANRNFFSNPGDGLSSNPNVVGFFPPDLSPTTSPGLKSMFIESLWEGRPFASPRAFRKASGQRALEFRLARCSDNRSGAEPHF